MSVNKVDVNGVTVLDLTQDSVTPATLKKGETAHDASGAAIVGEMESGGAKETWVIKSSATGEFATTQISFTSNGQKFTSIGANYDDSGTFMILRYDNNEVAGWDIYGGGAGFEFDNEAYRKLTFDTPPSGALLTWLQSNAVKQPDGTAVQETKALTITSNGLVSVTPDAPYDAMSSVDVTVDVRGGGGVETVTLKVVPDGIPVWSYSVFATGIDGVFKITDFGTYDVVKNSMLFLSGNAMSKQNLTEIFREAYIKVYEVIDNAKLSLA